VGGAVGTIRLAHQDDPAFVSPVLTNSAGIVQTFGASNLFGWTRWGEADMSKR
jgi:hypothetical protein